MTLALREDADERVEEAVEEMLNELWRKIKWQYGDYRWTQEVQMLPTIA